MSQERIFDPRKYQTIAHTGIQTTETHFLLIDLAWAEIPVIGLKGITLLERVYTQLGQRSMHDVDLLIPHSKLEEAEAILEIRGYVCQDAPGLYGMSFAREFMGQLPYSKGAMVIELHWHIVSHGWFRATTAFDLDALWTRAVPAEIAGAPALRLCPEDEVLHLCYHTAVHHGLAHPHGYRDILGVLRVEHDTLDWPTLAERARAWRVSVAVWAALSVARGRMQEARIKNQESRIENHASHTTLHAEELVPESAFAALRVPRWRQRLLRPFVQRAMTGQAALVSGTMRFLGVLLVDRVRDLPGVVLRGLFPGRRWLQLRYDLSPRQAFWQQFIYPLHVLARGLGALLRATTRNS
jgi:hypothetical protein